MTPPTLKAAVKPARLRPPDAQALAGLAALLERGKVLTRSEARERYSRDESTRLYALPDAVVIPADEAEVALTLKWAALHCVAIVPRGAGTGVAGGSVAVGGGVILSLEKLNALVEIDEENLTVTCQPGLITATLQEEVERRGLFYPPDPASSDDCSIGGNVVVGAGGARAVKYGTTRDYVLGMRVVLADGTITELGGKNVKDATGYHLMELFIGSEGTLGIVTEITLRLIPLPSRTVSLLIAFKSIEEAAGAVADTIKQRIIPAVAEFIDDVAIEAASRHLGRELPGSNRTDSNQAGDRQPGSGSDSVGAYVFIRLDGEDATVLAAQMERISDIATAAGALDIFAAEDHGQQTRLWESRRVLGTAMKELGGELGKADVVVPRGRVPQLVRRVKTMAAELELTIACFGHAGDGNVHVNILRMGMAQERWDELLAAAMKRLMVIVADLKGRPSGEHGIGVLKRQQLADFIDPVQLELMRRVKDAFDPQHILNPGKVL
jgi:glycolate oxidase